MWTKGFRSGTKYSPGLGYLVAHHPIPTDGHQHLGIVIIGYQFEQLASECQPVRSIPARKLLVGG